VPSPGPADVSPTSVAVVADAAIKPAPIDPLKGLGQRVCRYFLDFLETEFKRQQAHRRRILGRTDKRMGPGRRASTARR
jgi:hypothetical protein